MIHRCALSSSLQAEAKAITEAVDLAVSRNFSSVVVETDSKILTDCLSDADRAIP